jgi:hypothetical protein
MCDTHLRVSKYESQKLLDLHVPRVSQNAVSWLRVKYIVKFTMSANFWKQRKQQPRSSALLSPTWWKRLQIFRCFRLQPFSRTVPSTMKRTLVLALSDTYQQKFPHLNPKHFYDKPWMSISNRKWRNLNILFGNLIN